MRDWTGFSTKAATHRIGCPVGAVLVALALAATAPADDRFPAGAGLTAEDHARIGASTLFLSGFPTGAELCSEAAFVSAGQDMRLWPGELARPPLIDPDARALAGAATLFMNGCSGGGDAYTELAYLCAGQDERFWTFFDANLVRPIPSWALDKVRDKTPIPKDAANPRDPANQELDAYFDMIVYANRTAPAALDKVALREEGLWAKVFQDPEMYRGKVLHFEGSLKRLRQYPAQLMAVQGGAKNYYEGYLSVDAWQDDPVFFICTELPPDLKPGETLNVPVSLSGYFYKIFRYTAADTLKTHKDRLAPLLIGRTITVTGAPRRRPRSRKAVRRGRNGSARCFSASSAWPWRCCSCSATGFAAATGTYTAASTAPAMENSFRPARTRRPTQK